MKNLTGAQVAEYYALKANAEQKNKQAEAPKTKAIKKNTNAVFKVMVLILLGSAATFFLTGCFSYHPECDQTKNERSNMPSSCRGVYFGGTS